ncbi:MAG: type II toxin-antitoxin system RelE/ParE family toxin [Bryobacterales bacterium]|nr:type II toxin-antitoxin system RelE/ParE family toxin [Bryobacterales bacterium]MDE0629517.1 type II toxin-antitoxin system RelE/ParE family toxin [Bryobacterales bacterium]
MKIRHKGLRALHERDDRSRLPANLVPRLRRILFRLQAATRPGSADAPGFRLHPLKGKRTGQWSVRVSGNWRVVFRFGDAEDVDVDLVDHH